MADVSTQKGIERIAEIVSQIESAADPNVRATTKELLESVMALHGAALEHILETASVAGAAGEAMIRKWTQDDVVSSVLLLYGLHPDDLPVRVSRAIEKTRALLEPHGARAELVSISDDGIISLRLHLKAHGCGSTAATLKSTLEGAIQDAAPDAASVVVEETGATTSQSGFVPLGQLLGSKAVTAVLAGAIPGESD